MKNPISDKKDRVWGVDRTIRNGNLDSFAGGTRVIFRTHRRRVAVLYYDGFRIVRNKA